MYYMIARVVIINIDLRRPTRYCHVTKASSPQLLLFRGLTNCDVCNSFRPLHLRPVSARRIRSSENCQVTSFQTNVFLPTPILVPELIPSLHQSRSLSLIYVLTETLLHPLCFQFMQEWGPPPLPQEKATEHEHHNTPNQRASCFTVQLGYARATDCAGH
jgi:hypothetical protein